MNLFEQWLIFRDENNSKADRDSAFNYIHKVLSKLFHPIANRYKDKLVWDKLPVDFAQDFLIMIYSNVFKDKDFNDEKHLINSLSKRLIFIILGYIKKRGLWHNDLEEFTEIENQPDNTDKDAYNTAKHIIGFGFDEQFVKYKTVNTPCHDLLTRKYYSEEKAGLKGVPYEKLVVAWSDYKDVKPETLKKRTSKCYDDLRKFLTSTNF